MCVVGYVVVDDDVDRDIKCCCKGSSVVEYEDQRWIIGVVEYYSLILKMFQLLMIVEEKLWWHIDVPPWCCWKCSLSSFLHLIIVSIDRIPFSLRGSVEIL